MNEKEIVDESYLLQEAMASRPRQPLNKFQQAHIDWWDEVEMPRLEQLMQQDKEYKINHKAWEYRQFNS